MKMEVFRIEQYVDMVLQYLRLDSTAKDLVLQRCQLDAVVRQTVRKYAKLFILKKIQLVFQETKWEVLSDEKWLCFLLEQLLSNALKYTPEGGKISIFLDGETNLVIADTGIGIAPEDLPRVFEKGFTGNNGRMDKKPTGIALPLPAGHQSAGPYHFHCIRTRRRDPGSPRTGPAAIRYRINQ